MVDGRVMDSLQDFQSFVAAKRASAIHFDAEWDIAGRAATRHRMKEAERVLGVTANFGEVDCDHNSELAKSIPVLNVPLVAYYLDSKLIAALVGAGQNVLARVERVLGGERIGYDDGTEELEMSG